ncbi:hypothetical protein HHI36_012962, partial [Cryptolaemus montrouzieri]
ILPDVGQSSEDEYECTNTDTDTHLELSLVGNMDEKWYSGSSINTKPDEIKSFVGIEILMGVVKMPSMTKKLRRLLHFLITIWITMQIPYLK